MSTHNDANVTTSTNNVETFEHSTPDSLAATAGINERTASRLFNVAAMNDTNEIIVELDTEKGRWLIEKLTGVSTNAIMARAQADGPDGILVQNAAPASKISYAIGQMQRALDKYNETDDTKYETRAYQYYHAAHSRIRLPEIDANDDLADVTFGVHPTGESNEIGEWLPKQHITAIHKISPEAHQNECFIVSKEDGTLTAARGSRDAVDVFVGLECEAYEGTNSDGESYTQRKVEINANPEYRPIMRALYNPTYTTYEDDLKRWRATLTDIEDIIDHLTMNDIIVGIHPVTVKAISTAHNVVLADIYHSNGGKPTTEATTFELVEDTDTTEHETGSFDELAALDDLPELNTTDTPASNPTKTDTTTPNPTPDNTTDSSAETNSEETDKNQCVDEEEVSTTTETANDNNTDTGEPDSDSDTTESEPSDAEVEAEFKELLE